MNKKTLIIIFIILITLTGCAKVEEQHQEEQPQEEITYTMPTEAIRPVSDEYTTIELKSNDLITINESGTYIFKGETKNTEIIIDGTENDRIELILDNVKITNENKPVITVRNIKELLITTKSKSKNTFESNVDVITSESIINIGGSGTLTINTDKSAISSTKDIILESSKLNISSKKDSIKTDGSIYILKGTYNISSNRDILDSNGALLINNGVFTLTTTKETKDEDDESRKGLKAEKLIQIENGTFNINTYDDAKHSNLDLVINNGDYTISSGDDGIHADNNITLNNGVFKIKECREGIEGTIVKINDGEYTINSSDDSINAKAGTEEAEKYTKRNGNEVVWIEINGGNITATANGDVLDSNGDIYLNGGTLKLHGPSNSATEGALMASGTVHFKGGTIALTSITGQKYRTDSEQPIIFISFLEEQKKGNKLVLKDENKNTIIELKTKQKYIEATFTSPDLKIGSTYTLYQNDKKLTDITINNIVTKKGADGKRYTGGYK